MPIHKNQIIPLAIHGLSSDGNAVGRFEGKAIFVPGGAVGDMLQVTIVKNAKTHAFGRIHQVVTPGPGRQKADCPIAGVCGGCSFRHLTYKAELAAKQTFVEDALQRIGKLEVPVLEILPSPQQDRYRNKAQYPVAEENGAFVYGFYAGRSHRIVPCADCLLQPTLLNQIAARTAGLLQQLGCTAYNEATRTGLIRHIYLRQGGHSGQVLLCLVATGQSLPQNEVFVDTMVAEFPAIKSIVLNHNPVHTNVILGKHSKVLFGNGTIKDALCDVPLRLGVHSFSQVNTAGAEHLFATAQNFAALTGGETLLDLYCGAGVIGLSMAARCKQLIGVEIVPEAVENAKHSAAQMGLQNTRFLCEDAGTAATRLAAEGTRPDVIVVDPPRKGCDEQTLAAMVAMAPARIVMVSCNPATMARDLAILTQSGYVVKQVQPVDMFPRTKHVECVVLMYRKGN
ncbi:23S rRNA (uracil(1939)-C(5))-methyltransferase RlmD [Ruminococcaceae bacterium OttesenSCG-928-A16]|nr:23S rRNA (uracil(1939)-C(5))-methyltransferase RlmD [Ruminococcaceae bacterium OttesenSCG-928-A16]